MAVLVASLVATFFPCAAFAQPVQPTLKLQVIGGRPVVDGVYLNGQGPYRFLLDTGTQVNMVEAGLAKKLGLVGTFERELLTPSGSSHLRGGMVGKVSLGPVETEGQEFLFTNFDAEHTLSPDIRGILGQEFLAHFDYMLDFQHHGLTFGAVAAEGAHVPVRVVYGCMTVATNQGDLLLDSGADMLFLFRNSVGATTAQVRASSGLSAPVSVDRAPGVRIGERMYYPTNVEYRAVAGAPEAGLLPTSLFHAIFVSNSEGYVVFDPGRR
jgi:hypothetical protein